MALPTSGTVMNPKNFKQVQGSVELTATGDSTVLAAPGAGKYIRLQKAIISISVFSATGKVILEDGVSGTKIWDVLAKDGNCGSYLIDFGESGLKLSVNTLLNLTVEIANVTCRCVAVGYVEEI